MIVESSILIFNKDTTSYSKVMSIVYLTCIGQYHLNAARGNFFSFNHGQNGRFVHFVSCFGPWLYVTSFFILILYHFEA